jgi:hypothetical protein
VTAVGDAPLLLGPAAEVGLTEESDGHVPELELDSAAVGPVNRDGPRVVLVGRFGPQLDAGERAHVDRGHRLEGVVGDPRHAEVKGRRGGRRGAPRGRRRRHRAEGERVNGGVSGSNGARAGRGRRAGAGRRLLEDHITPRLVLRAVPASWPGSAPLQCGSALIRLCWLAGWPAVQAVQDPLDTANGFYGVLRPCTLAETAVVWDVEGVHDFSD